MFRGLGVEMNICIAYESKYGNGKKCVDYLHTVLNKEGHDVATYSVHDAKPKSLPRADLYIFSTPTHVGGPPRQMKKFLKNFETEQDGAKYVLLTTCMDPKTKSLKIMEELLQPREMTKVSDGIKIKVNGLKGPLESEYEGKLDTFIKEITGGK